eukprot:TRINITY_DN28732_c0_g1_i1.p1 TRINITY_DN28732_c0_g1~~TRINITY_DN28732_c0_g1_i1.p1  ORF type:complete len:200 (-),score=9.66 TRINITY_DN28732_c0_g1_i1:248-790(-)
MDRLTELQFEIDELTRMFFTCIGVLQRDAPPSYSLGQEVPPGTEERRESIQKQVKDMAMQVMQAYRRIDELIDSLPELGPSDDADCELLAQRDEQNRAMAVELRNKQAEANAWLVKVQEVMLQISKDRISRMDPGQKLLASDTLAPSAERLMQQLFPLDACVTDEADRKRKADRLTDDVL